MKVFIHTVHAVGHIFACVGLGQAIQHRGHQVVFLIDENFAGQVEKFGFETIKLKPAPKDENNKEEQAKTDDAAKEHPVRGFAKKLTESCMLSNKPAKEKLKIFDPNDKSSFFENLLENAIAFDPQMKEAIDTYKPDLIIVDNFLLNPCIHLSAIPYVSLFSGNPLLMYHSDKLPPYFSGLSINATEEAKAEHRKIAESTFSEDLRQKLHRIWKAVTGNPPPADVSPWGGLGRSPYLNMYGYPEELDYKHIVTRPANLIGVDAFARETPEKFELPADFKAKIKPGDKLIYLSMGSMGAANTDMVNRLLELVSDSRHKFIVSTGPLHEDIRLPENAWGQGFLPQTSLLPMVDLVITHGGNNSLTEAFSNGKPMIVMPLFGDQWDNAQRLQETGFGLRMNPFECTKEELSAAIRRLLNDDELALRLKAAAERMANSNSKEKAVIELEKLAEKYRK